MDEANGLPYLVMEYVAGISLQERLDRAGPLELEEILRIGLQAAAGLAAAHAQGLVHRDIKPANILLENGVERVKITDFGLARAADDASLTQSGVVAGTPQYMAPEQARGEPVDHRADLFSLGSVLYAMCTGRPPFRASSTLAVLRRVCEDEPRPIREVNPEVPDWLAAIIAKLHAKDPADRFQSAAEVARLLARCLSHVRQPALVPPPRAVRFGARRGWPAARRGAAAAAVVTAAALGVLALAALAGRLPLSARSPAPRPTPEAGAAACPLARPRAPWPGCAGRCSASPSRRGARCWRPRATTAPPASGTCPPTGRATPSKAASDGCGPSPSPPTARPSPPRGATGTGPRKRGAWWCGTRPRRPACSSCTATPAWCSPSPSRPTAAPWPRGAGTAPSASGT